MEHKFVVGDVGSNYGTFYRVTKVNKNGSLEIIDVGRENSRILFAMNSGKIYHNIEPVLLTFCTNVGVKYC